MQLTKEARINYWNEHIKNAALHEGGIHGYSQENKSSNRPQKNNLPDARWWSAVKIS